MSVQFDAVFFDVGSTLIAPYPSVAYTMASVAREHGHHLSEADFERYMPAMNAYYESEYERNGDFWCSNDGAVEIWMNMYRYVCGLMGLEADAEAIAHESYALFRQPDHWLPYPDTVPCLNSLKERGYKLGVISNWDAALEDLLACLGLLSYFDGVAVSAKLGCRKPDPAMFLTACKRLEVVPRNAVHIGDLPSADGDGAYAAGMTPIIIDRHDYLSDCPYNRVLSLVTVPDLLDKMVQT